MDLVSDVCSPDPTLQQCPHFEERGGYTVGLTSGEGANYHRWAEHVCAECLADGSTARAMPKREYVPPTHQPVQFFVYNEDCHRIFGNGWFGIVNLDSYDTYYGKHKKCWPCSCTNRRGYPRVDEFEN